MDVVLFLIPKDIHSQTTYSHYSSIKENFSRLNSEIITESAIVATFIADAYPSYILKKSDEEGGALQRARISFFVDTYFSKINSFLFQIFRAKQGAEKEEVAEKYVDAIVKEIEPLLQDAAPYFGGASKFTLAEVRYLAFLSLILELLIKKEMLTRNRF